MRPVAEQGQLSAVDTAAESLVTWRFASPYVFVGGLAVARYDGVGTAGLRWQCSRNQKTWTDVEAELIGDELTASLDELLSPLRQPTYEFWLRLLWQGDIAVTGVAFDHDIQTAALSAPELQGGKNVIVYTDDSEEERQVQITHQWMERSDWHSPTPPSTAIFPADGSVVQGTKLTFRWSRADDPDGDEIADYHFELSEYPDMRWPLSPNFEKVISLTRFAGTATYELPYHGLLNSATSYYWRVRAMDSAGVWGAWSKTFRFETRATGVPRDLSLIATGDGKLELRWNPNQQGSEAVAFKVYGSNERGFSVSDDEQLIFCGRGFMKTIEEYDAIQVESDAGVFTKNSGNLCSRVVDYSLQVVGPDLTLPNANKAFYRVVAVDAAGNESGPSDYVEVVRPHIYNLAPNGHARRPYVYSPRLIRSIGDLRSRNDCRAAFWNVEHVTFHPVRLPPGLKQHPTTGMIYGVPSDAGTFEIVFDVSVQASDDTEPLMKRIQQSASFE
ncbi:MAG: hypothetical protein CMJ64_20000 [Planctomycetaceae bacterium]|nr:hypothetical protein [Planctomycetaceae bacterium]